MANEIVGLEVVGNRRRWRQRVAFFFPIRVNQRLPAANRPGGPFAAPTPSTHPETGESLIPAGCVAAWTADGTLAARIADLDAGHAVLRQESIDLAWDAQAQEPIAPTLAELRAAYSAWQQRDRRRYATTYPNFGLAFDS